MKKRYDVYKNFKEYVQNKDVRSMDDICAQGDAEFKLQAQQLFLREFTKENPEWNSLLMYHEIGSGKTCTAIVMADEYLRTHPNGKIKIILPARLRTNFIDELISPCGMNKYITPEEFAVYHSSTSSERARRNIKSNFMASINKTYDIMSFDKLKIEAMKHRTDLKSWASEFTKDSMIIVDEVHNLLSSTYDKRMLEIVASGIAPARPAVKGMNTILFKVLTKYADPTSKMIFLTATPIFDNIGQMRELVQAMVPKGAAFSTKSTITEMIECLRGKVSYFPGTSVNAYPKVENDTHEIPFSKTQDAITKLIQDTNKPFQKPDPDDPNLESFFAKQRQVTIACLPHNMEVKPNNYSQVLSNMPEYCPKIKKVLEVIRDRPGKHVVYSNFIKHGLLVVEEALKIAGWRSLASATKDNSWSEHKGMIYARWDGSVSDVDKQYIKSVVNGSNNIFGDRLRCILGSPSIKEGVSFKHIQQMHILDPLWNQSAKNQVEGRAIRYCSHVDILPIHTPLRRVVVLNYYKSVPRPNGACDKTCDQLIDGIIAKKVEFVRMGESALKKVAIDHYLFRKLYVDSPLASPVNGMYGFDSPIELDKNGDIKPKKKRKDNENSTCPKARRPDKDTGLCPPGTTKRDNAQGFPCCYKVKRTAVASTCPKSRQPVNGECPPGFTLKLNKQGDQCCYKTTRSSRS